LAIFVSAGLQPERERLRTFILEGGEPYAGLVEIRPRESRHLDESNAASAAEELAAHLSRIPGAFPRAQDIALFVAGPASLAFIAGRAINPNVIRSTWVANRTGVGPSGHELAFALPFRPEPEHEAIELGQDEPEVQKDPRGPERAVVRIEEVRLSHFRAIENGRLSLGSLTMLVGRNGAGKTTVAEALDFLRDALTEGLEIALERRGGIEGIRQRHAEDTPRGELPDVTIAVVMRVTSWPDRGSYDDTHQPDDTFPRAERVLYGIRLRMDPVSAELSIDEVLRTVPRRVSFERHGNDLTFSIEGIAKPALAGASLALPLVVDLHPGWRMVLDALRQLRIHTLSPAAIRNEPRIESATYLRREGDNAGDSFKALETDKRDVSWIVEHLAGVTPGIVGVRAGSQAGRRTLGFLQRITDDAAPPITFRGAEISDGTLRALGVLLALRQRPTPSLVFIDEIEDSVHPAALHVLLDAAAATASERCQVVLTSHSPEVLSHPAVTADNVRILTWRNGRSRIHRLSEGTRASLVPPDTIGDLLRINALEPDEVPERIEGDIFDIE
jgi:predicted ATPase